MDNGIKPSNPSLDEFQLHQLLDTDVDIGQFFSKEELEDMGPTQQNRYKNIVQNYGILLYMGLPAVRPDFMDRHAYRSRMDHIMWNDSAESFSETNSDDVKWKSVQMLLSPDVSRKTELEQKCTPSTEEASEVPEKKIRSLEEHRNMTHYMDLDNSDNYHFLYCEACDKEYDNDCPVHGSFTQIIDTPVPGHDPHRALHTLPEGLVVRESSIQGAGLGVFAEKLVPARTKFGPYCGMIITNPEFTHSPGYCWQINKDGKPSHFVDATDGQQSNWMRYVNCANTEADQNLVAFQHEGEIYYRTSKPITPGTELLVYYGLDCARDLGASRDENALLKPSVVYGTVCYPCIYCGTNFSSAGTCVLHLLRSHGGKKTTARHILILTEWLRTYTEEKPYKCDVCQYTCNQKGHLDRHMRMHKGEKPYKCDVCQYSCLSKDTLVVHMRIHTGEKPYSCDFCEYTCNWKGNLVVHMRTHTGERPYKCGVCGYASNQKCNLDLHMRTHTGEKPFKCNVCEYTCREKGVLKVHMRIHTGEKPYKCDVCEYTCRAKVTMVTHMRIHTGERPYQCNVCEKTFNENSNLVKHMRIHTGEKPYKCTVCEYKCSAKVTLVTHMRKHTGEKPYKCIVCEKPFSEKSNLVKHTRIHTGE